MSPRRQIFDGQNISGQKVVEFLDYIWYLRFGSCLLFGACNLEFVSDVGFRASDLKRVGARGFEPPTSRTRTVRAKPGCATPRFFLI